MKEAHPIVVGIVAFIIIVFCSIPIILNLVIFNRNYKDPNDGTEYRRNTDECGLDHNEDNLN